MNKEGNRPLVWVAVIIRNDWKVLLWKRLWSHGAGTYAFPWWHLEFGEEIEECAARELFEETGLNATNFSISYVSNDIMSDVGKHYVTVFVTCDYISWTPEARESTKCQWRERVSRNDLPTNVFLPIQNILKHGYNPFSK